MTGAIGIYAGVANMNAYAGNVLTLSDDGYYPVGTSLANALTWTMTTTSFFELDSTTYGMKCIKGGFYQIQGVAVSRQFGSNQCSNPQIYSLFINNTNTGYSQTITPSGASDTSISVSGMVELNVGDNVYLKISCVNQGAGSQYAYAPLSCSLNGWFITGSVSVDTNPQTGSANAVSSGGMYNLLYGFTGNYQVNNFASNGLFSSNGTTRVNRVSERVGTVTANALNYVNVVWDGVNSVYYLETPPAANANVVMNISSLPLTAANTYTTYNCSLVSNAASNTTKGYANSIFLNGVSNTALLKINGGAASVSLVGSNTIIQTFIITCLASGVSPSGIYSTVCSFS
jgi:hypothetical protein